MQDLSHKLKAFGDVEVNYSFKKLTTLHIGGNAKYVVYPRNMLALDTLIMYLKENNISYKLFGKGSNILCGDDDYEGCIIKLDRYFTDYYFQDNYLYAQSGCSIIFLANEAMKQDLSGLEFASGIPATLGGTIFMNAGAYKSSMSNIIDEVLVYKDHSFKWLKNEELDFSYRYSKFHDDHELIIIGAKIKLVKEDGSKIFELVENRRKRRMETQPLNYPSAGSVFRNFDDKPVWQLIDEIGYRGYVKGGAKVSEKHSNFIVNNDNAKAQDFLDLVNEIKAKVKEQYSRDMIMEVEKFNCK